MKKTLIYCVSAAILAMVFMLAGQANAQSDCEVAIKNDDQLTIECGPSNDVIEVFAGYVVDNGDLELIVFVEIGDEGPVDFGPLTDLELITIETGDGSNDVSVHDLDPVEGTEYTLFVTTGRGPDKVSVGPNVVTENAVEIDTGQGDDTVLLGLNVSSEFDVQVFTRGGSDLVRTYAAVPLLAGIVAGRDIIIRGGGGPGDIDAIVVGENSLFAGKRIRLLGFESFGAITGSGD